MGTNTNIEISFTVLMRRRVKIINEHYCRKHQCDYQIVGSAHSSQNTTTLVVNTVYAR